MDLLQDRQVLLEERTTEWSHHASRLLCREDPLWSCAILCCLSGGPLWGLVVPITNGWYSYGHRKVTMFIWLP